MEEYITVTAKTVKDAILEASLQLETFRDNIEYEVIEEGSAGFLGFGSKKAVIKARKKVTVEDFLKEEFPEEKPARRENNRKDFRKDRKDNRKDFRRDKKQKSSYGKEEKASGGEEKFSGKETGDFWKKEEKKEQQETAEPKEEKNLTEKKAPAEKKVSSEKKEYGNKGYEKKEYQESDRQRSFEQETAEETAVPAAEERKERKLAQLNPEEQAEVVKKAEKFLNDVFASIEMEVKVSGKFEDEVLNIDLEGEDMGILIGKRGQTLDSLQYLTSLVVNRGTPGYIRVKVDTENYRSRRKETLENLARNIAFKVKRTRRPVFLEPMNPYERRIIHSALQNDPYVTTHSEGEEPYRKVVVTLKRNNNR